MAINTKAGSEALALKQNVLSHSYPQKSKTTQNIKWKTIEKTPDLTNLKK